MGPYPLRERRDLDVGSERQLSPRAGFMSASQSVITQYGWGFHRRISQISSPVCWSCRDVKGIRIRGWGLALFVSSGTSALARGAAFAARSLHEPQPISNHPIGLGNPPQKIFFYFTGLFEL